MYTGTLINDLIKTVEQAEKHAREVSQDAELEHWYAKHHRVLQVETALLGVA
jgi:hypothetical protein